MKQFGAILILAMIVLLALPQEMLSQPLKQNPAKLPLYMYNNIASGAPYVTNTIDTSGVIKVGGASEISFKVTVLDTALMDYYIDYRVIGTNTSWANALTDSLINNGATSNSGLTQEYIFRSSTVNKYGGLGFELRTRKAWRNVTQGTSTATYTEQLLFKP